MAITNDQIQAFVDQRVRPHCELARALVLIFQDDKSVIDDVYNNLNGSPTWVDTPNRSNPPAHKLSASDVLAFNTFISDVSNYIKNHGQYPVVLAACGRPVLG